MFALCLLKGGEKIIESTPYPPPGSDLLSKNQFLQSYYNDYKILQ